MNKIGIIIGSVRDGRVGEFIAKHYFELASKHTNVAFDLIDLKQINLPLLNEPYPAAANNYKYQHTKDWSKIISEYKGFVVITPEYNHGYPAALKNAFDYLYLEWKDKPIVLVGYGYSSSGGSATMQLKPVLQNLNLKHIDADILINLNLNLKDGLFVTSELLDNQINTQIEQLIKAVLS